MTDPAPAKKSSLRSNAALMASGVALSRFTGLLREQSFAWLFGASASMDAFVAALRIPNFFRDLLAENVATSAMVPVYAAAREKKGPEAAARFAGAALTSALVASTVIAGAGILATPWICSLVAPGFGDDPLRARLTVMLTRQLFPLLIFVSLSAFLQALQNAEGSYFIPAISSAGLNLGFIVCGWLLSQVVNPPILGEAWGALFGGLISILILLPGCSKSLARPTLADFRGDELRDLLRMTGPLVLGVAAVNINILVNTITASYAEPGAMAYLNYAYRVMHLPLGLVAVTLSTVALAPMARAFHSGDGAGYRATFTHALDLALRLALPATAGIVLLRTDIVGVLFHYGRFTEMDLSHTAHALLAFAAGIPAFTINRVYSASFYAQKNSRLPVTIGTAGVCANILLNILAVSAGWGYFGIAASSSVAGWLQTVLYISVSMRRGDGADWSGMKSGIALTAAGLVLMALVLAGVERLGIESRIARAALEIAAGAAVYALVALRGSSAGWSRRSSTPS